jgi:putative ABC transport system ATP-binding protein
MGNRATRVQRDARPGLMTVELVPQSDGEGRAHRPLLEAQGVRKVYRTAAGEVHALRDVSLRVGEGEFVAVMGPSGSGKTTLLNCLSGLDDIDAGRVVLDGASLHELSDAARTRSRAESMGFVFQQFNLIPVLSAVENVEIPLLLSGVRAGDARRRAGETLERVGLGHRVHHRPSELSGGEQQRVTIARALAGHPRIVWADEPTGALDSESAEEVMKLMREVHEDGVTIVLVTHDHGVGAQAERLIAMRDGQIVSDGAVDHSER